MKKLSIIIPAYNEEKRIEKTLRAYCTFFDTLEKNKILQGEIIVVLNGCVDGTLDVVKKCQSLYVNLHCISVSQAGKGLALKAGFVDALKRNNDIIGFVDADMATSPQAYYELVKNIDGFDGVIASRYMQGAKIYPPRPFIKRWGSRLLYESFVYLLLGLDYKDLQCGAKVFKRSVIESIVSDLRSPQWAFDVELLYLCKRYKFTIKEVPTVWHDQDGSKLRLSSGFRMLAAVGKLRFRYSSSHQFHTVARYSFVVLVSCMLFYMFHLKFLGK